MTDTVNYLVDKDKIITVLNRYAEACDHRKWELFQDVFAENLTGSYGYSGLGVTPQDSLDSLQSQQYPTWSFGLDLHVPLLLGVKQRNGLEVEELKRQEGTHEAQIKQIETLRIRTGQERANLANARYDLSKVRIESPIEGIVTRRNIEEGETVVIGTMNNPGTQLLTIADMSIIEAEVEVDVRTIALDQLTCDVKPGVLADLEWMIQFPEEVPEKPPRKKHK